MNFLWQAHKAEKNKIKYTIFGADFKGKTVQICKSNDCDFCRDWSSRSYLSNKKESWDFDAPTPSYEFSSVDAQSWK